MFSHDPAYVNANANTSPPSDVSGYSCLDQVTSDDFQRAQMWLGGFMNADVDGSHPPFTPALSFSFGDASASSYFLNCDGSPATMASMPQTPMSEIADVHGGPIQALLPQFAPVQNYVFLHPMGILPLPYTQYPIGNNICERGFISHYSTLTPNLVASSLCVLCVFAGDLLISFYREKHYVDAHFTPDNAMAQAENDPAHFVGVETNEQASTRPRNNLDRYVVLSNCHIDGF